jgi:hypothetical protein
LAAGQAAQTVGIGEARDGGPVDGKVVDDVVFEMEKRPLAFSY